MSKIGKQPIKISEGVTVVISSDEVIVKNAKNEIKTALLKGIKPVLENNLLKLELINDSKQARSNWGTMRSLLANAVYGLTMGFEKTLFLEGVGYRVIKEGNDLSMNLGFSHPVRYKAPAHITFEVEKNSILKIKGFDKALVGQVTAEIRSFKKPEPYKGKGFRYSNEIIRRKAGKKAAAATGSTS
ncbi:MAG: 50S ribosomal protein L6 [Patescibacteria group bacterium]|nr:50S ribosomal protein L6 [Patescibacteria group bacterium]